jgi:hypothetical protein
MELSKYEAGVIVGWAYKIRKAGCEVKPNWTVVDFTDAAQAPLQALKEFFEGEVTAATLSEVATAQGVWAILRASQAIERRVMGLFLRSPTDVAYGFKGTHANATMWLGCVFQALTGCDYNSLGRIKDLGNMKLVEDWPFGAGKQRVENHVNTVRDEPIRTTWNECQHAVGMLLEATGFEAILRPQVFPSLEIYYREVVQQPGAGVLLWKKVEDLVVDALEGRGGLYEDWTAYRESVTQQRAYHGRHQVEFEAVKGWSGRPSAGRARDGYRNTGKARINALPANPTGTRYLSQEEADKKKWEPCEYHIEQILRSGRTDATRDDLQKVVHLTCACLHLSNPALYCTIHPGGAEELIRRATIPNDAERSVVWREQKAEVDRQMKKVRPDAVYVTEAYENVIEFDCNGERVSITVDAAGGGSCV